MRPHSSFPYRYPQKCYTINANYHINSLHTSSFNTKLLRSVELLVHKMQQEVDIQLQAALEQVHELMGFELGLQHVFDGD